METKPLAIDLELLRLSEAKISYSLHVVGHIQLLLQLQVSFFLEKLHLFVKKIIWSNLIKIVSFGKSIRGDCHVITLAKRKKKL